jgi:hypothetical protein
LNLLGELGDILHVGALAHVRSPLPGDAPLRFIVEAFLVGAFERGRFHQHALTLVPAAGTTESNDDC